MGSIWLVLDKTRYGEIHPGNIGHRLVAGDTTGLSSPSLTSPQAVDNSLYYNSYPSGGGYDYEGYPVLSQGDQDRTDILSTGLFGGITVAMFLTAFAAALLGALVAPLLTAGVNRISEIELPEIPEITLPELPKEAVEEVRALESEYPWVKMAENVYSIIRQKVNKNKFSKFSHNDKL